jgi:hypothetical protein
VHFGHAVYFGRFAGDHVRPGGIGALDGDALRRRLFEVNVINMPSVVMRRDLFARLGPFIERFPDDPSRTFPADDYEYFFRCLRAGVRFYYEPRTLVRYRQHGTNITADNPTVVRAMALVRHWYADDVGDRALTSRVLAPAHFKIGRQLAGEGRSADARREFRAALRYGGRRPSSANARAAIWVGILYLPARARRLIEPAVVAASRTLDDARGGRSAVLP